MLAITFHGAARTTTGSMHLLEANGLRILLDCGLFQGHRKEAFERNRSLAFDPSSIDCVILSHAHIDHSGNLPTLARNGFRGKVISTPATRALCDLMLRDSAHIQTQDLIFVNRKRKAQGKNLFEPLYEVKDVEAILDAFETLVLGASLELGNGITLTFHEAGHILGAASVQLDIQLRDGKTHRLVFSGDLGSPQPLIRPPARLSGADSLIIESTYADRDHPHLENVRGRLKGFIEDIHHQRSKLVIPAFSVGRTQNILYYLNDLVERGQIPRTPVYVDSPLSTKATAIYASHPECFDATSRELVRQGSDPLRFPGLNFTESVAESMALNTRPGPMIIMSASGMCEAGRIVHHLRNTIQEPRNIVLIVGYQAEHTLGRRIVERRPTVSIFGEEIPLNARVHTINALSAHADRRGLVEWIDSLNSPRLKHAFAVHGDEDKTAAMQALLLDRGIAAAMAPVPGQRVVLVK